MNSKVLNGSQRVVMDGVISDEECQELQRLTNVREPGDHTASLRAQRPPTGCFLGLDSCLPLAVGSLPPLPGLSAAWLTLPVLGAS